MATYIPGSKSFLPNYEPFTPDFKFLSNALDARTSKYETNYKQLNDLYGKVVYSDLSRPDTNQIRDQYANDLAPRLEQISGMDLSLAENVDAARGVFTPFFENDLIVSDIVHTNQFRQQMGFANRLLNSDKPEVRKKYWDVGVRAMEYQMQDFIEATPDQALQMPVPKYVQNVNLMDRSREILKESGLGEMESVQWTPDGRYIIKMTGGDPVAAPAYQILQDTLLDDPLVQRAYYTDAYVQMRDYVANAMDQNAFPTANAAKKAWADQTIVAVQTQLGLQLEQSEKEMKTAEANAADWETYNNVYGIQPGSPEEVAMNQSTEQYQAAQQKTQRYGQAYQFSTSNVSDTDALLNTAYNLMMQTNIAGDLQAAALEYADITRRIDVDEDPYTLADYKHRLKMNEILYKASLEGGGDKKSDQQKTTDDIMLDINAKLGTYGDFGKVVIDEDAAYENSQTVLDNEVNDLQRQATDLWVNGSMLLEQAAGTDGRLTFQAYDVPEEAEMTGGFFNRVVNMFRSESSTTTSSQLKTFNVLPNEAREILNRPENKEIVFRLMHDRDSQLNNTYATDVQLATSLPSLLNEGAKNIVEYSELPTPFQVPMELSAERPITEEQYEREQTPKVGVDKNNNPVILKGYPVAVNSPDVIAGVRAMSNQFKAQEILLAEEVQTFNISNLNNFRNIMQTAEGQVLMANSYKAGFPSIFDGMEIVNGDLYGNGKPGGILSKNEYIKAFIDYYSELSGNQNPFRVDADNVVIRKFGAISDLTMSDENKKYFSDREYNESIIEAATESYDDQKELLNRAYKKGSTGNPAYSAPRNLNAIFQGRGDGISGLSVAGTQITGTVNPRSENPDIVGYSLLDEAVTLMQSPNIELVYRAVGTDDDLRGKDLNFDDLTNSENAENFLNNVVLPELLALYENPGSGEQTTSDLYFTIDKTDIANISDDMDDAITTYTLNINPAYVNKMKLTGNTGVDLFGVAGLGDAEQSARTTDFTKIQIRVRKNDIDQLIPTDIGDISGSSPEFAIMRSQGQYTYSLPRGGSYSVWNTSNNPLEVGISGSMVVRNENGQYVSIPDFGGDVRYDPNTGMQYTSVTFSSVDEFNAAIKAANQRILDQARANTLSSN